jgi:cold-shock DNA-binding protein family
MSQATLASGPYRNSNLFSSYYLEERVSDLEAWDCNSEAEAAYEQIRNLWEKEARLLPSYNEDDLINIWIAPIVGILEHGTSSEVTLPDGGGYVDRLLFENDEVRREAAKLALDGDEDVFFHMEDVGGPDLEEGQEIEFDIESSPKGPRAANLVRN